MDKKTFRNLKRGQRVRATTSSASAGKVGTVVDPSAFVTDGQPRARVRWDDRTTVLVLPTSIEVADTTSMAVTATTLRVGDLIVEGATKWPVMEIGSHQNGDVSTVLEMPSGAHRVIDFDPDQPLTVERA